MLRQILIGCLLSLNFALFSANDLVLVVDNLGNNGNGCAKLTWTRCGASRTMSYIIFRSFENDSWRAIDTVSSSLSMITYVDTIYVCDEFVNYRIAVLDGSCTGSDSIKQRIVDKEGPAPTTINALSVNPQTNQIEIFWTPCPTPDAYGYRVFEQQHATASNADLDTIFGTEINSYTVKKTADTNLRFRIAAIDSCFNNGVISRERQAFACYVNGLMCERKLELSWSDARKSVSNIIRFDIMLSRNDSAFIHVATVDSLQNSAVIDVSGHLDKYRVYVRAVSADTLIYANSISDSIVLIAAPKPEFAYLETLNVADDNEKVEMRCYVDVATVWKNLFAYLADTLVKTVTYDEFLKNNHLLLPNQQAFYHFEISDTCGEIAEVSNLAKPIHLEAKLSDSTVDMVFSAYQGWYHDDIRYRVYEVADNDTTLKSELLGLTPASVYTHQLTAQNLNQIMSLKYYVIACEEGKNPYDIKATSKSNVVNLLSRNEIPVYFPTGFAPDGITKIYRPFYVSLSNDAIQFQIYNKFGQIVFSTNKPKDGWDGTFDGQAQSGGVYMYQFTLTRNGQTTQKQGVFTLIR